MVANTNASKSKGLATYYMEKRKIPKKNLVLLSLTDQETCSREVYEKKVIPRVRAFVNANDQIRAIVTVFGIPLRISSPKRSTEEQKKLDGLKNKRIELENQLTKGNITDSKIRKEKHDQLSLLNSKISMLLKRTDKMAAFDSELTLVKKEEYELDRWLPNPYYLGFKNKKTEIKRSEVLMTSRLDGADEAIVKRIINDSIEAEKNGLKGNAYFDARWKNPGNKKVSGYGFYDKSIHSAASLLSENNRIKVILNDADTLFKNGECPDAAIYCGWYSLANYIDAFSWQKGSVGYHIASSECVTLKNKKSNVWCKKMLDKGITATIGPVGEPYVQAFPVPEIFFNFLTEGYLTLAESYLVSLPYLSWKMVLVGDPLYRMNLKQ